MRWAIAIVFLKEHPVEINDHVLHIHPHTEKFYHDSFMFLEKQVNMSIHVKLRLKKIYF